MKILGYEIVDAAEYAELIAERDSLMLNMGVMDDDKFKTEIEVIKLIDANAKLNSKIKHQATMISNLENIVAIGDTPRGNTPTKKKHTSRKKK